jgi:hypothetical protein
LRINRVVYRFWHNRSVAGRVGYIGKDTHHPQRFDFKRRLKEKQCRKLYRALKKYPIKIWHKEILASGFRSDSTLIKAEIYWIATFDSKNKGYNCTDGGEGLLNPTAEIREKISKSLQGHSSTFKGRKHSKKSKKMISDSKKGKRMSSETKMKISKTLKGRVISSEHRAKISKALTGRKFSTDHKEKLSMTAKNRKFSKETRKKLSLSHMGNTAAKGMKHSVKTRKKMSRSHKERWKIRKRNDFKQKEHSN